MTAARIESLENRRLLAYAPDVSFGRDGQVPTGGGFDLIWSDANGLVVATLINAPGQASNRIERFTPAGQLDSSFKSFDLPYTSNYYVFAFGDRQGRVLAITLDPDGVTRLARFNADGTIDRSFGRRGSSEFRNADSVLQLGTFHATVAADGSIYIASLDRASDFSTARRHVYKFSAAGRLDTSFGTGGELDLGTTEIDSDRSTADGNDGFSFSTDPRGRLLVAQMPTFGVMWVACYRPDGSVDKTYGNKGAANYTIAGASSLSRFHAAFDAQGRVLVLTSESQFHLYRLTPNGRPDPSFGTDYVVTHAGSGDALIAQADGKILVQTSVDGRPDNLSFLRLNDDGTPDPTFDGDGVAPYIQSNRPREARNFNESVSPRLITQMADGNYLVGVGNYEGLTLEKIAPAQSVRRGTSGRLYVLGDDLDDELSITQPVAGQTRVTFNGLTYRYTKHINGLYALLGGGDNTVNANVNLPQSIVTGSANDLITTGDAADTVFSTGGTDKIFTNGGYDQISFRGGDKIINAGSGSGYITGGGGQAGRRYFGTPGTVRITGSTTDNAKEGGWKVDVRGNRVSVSVGGVKADVTIQANASAAVDATGVTRLVTTTVSARTVTYNATQAQSLLSVLDLDRRRPATARITTGPANDVIQSGSGPDTIDGGAGDDQINAGGGNDSVNGGDGYDALTGGAGDDTLLGGAGDDVLFANSNAVSPLNSARNILNGGPGIDSYLTEGDRDQLSNVEDSLYTAPRS